MINAEIDNKIVLINPPEIIKVISLALSKIDPRLMNHGERVAYIAAKTLPELDDKASFDLTVLTVLSVLHDIGAYKTSEIDDMLRFETESEFDHSLFGYLFLKNTTNLSRYAEAILYHHSDFDDPEMQESQYANYAQLIHLSDRADILMGNKNSDLSSLKRATKNKFNPDYVEALLRAEEKYHISENIRNGSFKKETELFAETIKISTEEIMDYLKLIVYAIDFRSPYTVTHTADTTIISMETAKLLSLNEHDCEALYLGAFLHDIGKIAIPQSILEKPGALTKEEFDIIKTHITQGEYILRGVVSDEICDIALRHHEKLDGSGYIYGLKADDLTLPQRIVAVADILSALSQQRSYKEAFPKQKVIAILNEMKDSGQLCPLVVDTVCDNYDTILANTEKSHDPVKTLYEGLIKEYNSIK